MSSSRITKRHNNLLKLRQMARDKAFIAHIRRVAARADAMPGWKKECLRSSGVAHA